MRNMGSPGSSGQLRRVGVAALIALSLGLVAIVVGQGFSSIGAVRAVEDVALGVLVAAALMGAAAFVAVRMAGWRDPESEADFEALVQSTERLAAEGVWGEDEPVGPDEDDDLFDPTEDEDFRALVRSAIDELPLEFHRALEHVAIVISDGGRRRRAYGLYQGDTVARDFFHDRIVIFRDTLLRDFSHDPELLKAQVTRTVRHELAHHLGWNEKGVHGLGL